MIASRIGAGACWSGFAIALVLVVLGGGLYVCVVVVECLWYCWELMRREHQHLRRTQPFL